MWVLVIGVAPEMQSESTAPDSVVESYILQVLDDFRPHDWDDAMIAVSNGFAKAKIPLGIRQSEHCLEKLIARGEVIEKWVGEFATLRRVRIQLKSAKKHPCLFID